MSNEIKVVIYGVGAVGRLIASSIIKRKGYKIVGAVDANKEIVGKDLGELLQIKKGLGVEITDNADELLNSVSADIVVHATSSYLRDTYEQIVKCIDACLNVISTCEELSYPWIKHPELASKIDKAADDKYVTVLGTGINPGFLMDTLPIVLSAACLRVDSIKVTRMMYSGDRRITYQKKIGTGLTKEQFKEKIKKGEITGHVGLFESTAQIASALGWSLDEIVETPPEPVIAEEELKTAYITVKKGEVAGLRNIAYGVLNGKKVVTLEFVSHAGIKEPYDEVIINGEPKIRQRIFGGVHGDIGTVAMIVNMIPRVIVARPGLLTMKDFALLSSTPEDVRLYISFPFKP
jgi:4-hydroxy-tetrahydrodipicolinate reductase